MVKEQQRRYYICVLHKVVDKAGIILLLNTRDPAGCGLVEVRGTQAQSQRANRLIFVLNKIGA
jgi:hypothetical protein